jgi:hypothetical protein
MKQSSAITLNDVADFRGISVDTNEWVYGYYVKCRGKEYILQKHDINGYDERWEGGAWVEIVAGTSGQYIGIDNVVNGERLNKGKVYSGDIIRFEDTFCVDNFEYQEGTDFINQAVVQFKDGRFTLEQFGDMDSGVLEELNDHEQTVNVIKYSETIGSIHKNPELIKRRKHGEGN